MPRRLRLSLVALVVVACVAGMLGIVVATESHRVGRIEELAAARAPEPGYTDVRRQELEASAPDVLVLLDAQDVLVDRAVTALIGAADTATLHCDGRFLVPWLADRARPTCESASETDLAWARRVVTADLQDAVLAGCVRQLRRREQEGLLPEHDRFQGYRVTAPGISDEAYAAHAERLVELQAAAEEIVADPVTCEQILATA